VCPTCFQVFSNDIERDATTADARAVVCTTSITELCGPEF
jgi:hypothetical protein